VVSLSTEFCPVYLCISEVQHGDAEVFIAWARLNPTQDTDVEGSQSEASPEEKYKTLAEKYLK
jgi:hypothetical protein